jgi:hypothetical protein
MLIVLCVTTHRLLQILLWYMYQRTLRAVGRQAGAGATITVCRYCFPPPRLTQLLGAVSQHSHGRLP